MSTDTLEHAPGLYGQAAQQVEESFIPHVLHMVAACSNPREAEDLIRSLSNDLRDELETYESDLQLETDECKIAFEDHPEHDDYSRQKLIVDQLERIKRYVTKRPADYQNAAMGLLDSDDEFASAEESGTADEYVRPKLAELLAKDTKPEMASAQLPANSFEPVDKAISDLLELAGKSTNALASRGVDALAILNDNVKIKTVHDVAATVVVASMALGSGFPGVIPETEGSIAAHRQVLDMGELSALLQEPQSNEHIVAPGESLSEIAAVKRVTTEQLLDANPEITDADLIDVDTMLVVPHVPETTFAASSTNSDVNVQSEVAILAEGLKSHQYVEIPDTIEMPSNPLLLKSLSTFANKGIKVTFSTGTIGQGGESNSPISIRVQFEDEVATVNVFTVLKEQQERLGISKLSYNRDGLYLLAPAPEREVLAPAEVKEPVLRGANIEAIQNVRGVDAQLIKDVVTYMIEKHGMTPKGAAYLTGNFIAESGLDPNVKPGDNGTAFGLGQWRFERLEGMPQGDLYGQIDFALMEMKRDGQAAHLPALLRNPEATDEQFKRALYKWERWGDEANRFEYAAQINDAISSNIESLATEHIRTGMQIKAELVERYEGVSGRLNDGELEELGREWGRHRLHPEAAQGFRELAKAFEEHFGRKIELTDSYRSYEQQVITKEQKKNYAATPGKSNHGWGLAIDFASNINNFGTAEHNWMVENAATYGWELPDWAHDNRGIEEPWHWEYAGKA